LSLGRFVSPLPFEQLLPPSPLRVLAVPDLQPSRLPLRKVRALLPFSHNAFNVMLAGKPEQLFTVAVHVVTIQEPLPMVRHNGAQAAFPVGQRQVPQGFAVSPEQIKSVKPGLPRRNSRSLNWVSPWRSRQTISPSRIADRARSSAGMLSANAGNDLN